MSDLGACWEACELLCGGWKSLPVETESDLSDRKPGDSYCLRQAFLFFTQQELWSWMVLGCSGCPRKSSSKQASASFLILKDFHFLDVRMTPLLQAYNRVRQKDGWIATDALCQWNLPSTARKPQLPKKPHPQTLPHPTDWKLITKLSGSLERETCDFCKVWVLSEKERPNMRLNREP